MEKYITIGVNKEHQIKAINDESDKSLNYYTFLDTLNENPFYMWSDYVILNYCYREDEDQRFVYPQRDIVAILDANNIYEQARSDIEELQNQIDELLFDDLFSDENGGVE